MFEHMDRRDGQGWEKEKKECCGTCRFHNRINQHGDWVCVNGRSDYCSDWTEYDFCCGEWEGRAQ